MVITTQTKFAKVMFLHLSVSHSVHGGGACSGGSGPGGCLLPGGWEVPGFGGSGLKGGTWSLGGGCLLPGGSGPGGACSRGGLFPGDLVPGGAWWRPPRRLLLRAVRILLKCILVKLNNFIYMCDFCKLFLI